jgi:hypothetical protein
MINSGLYLRQKFTFQAHDQKVIFIKKPVEHVRHVLMKALLWALYLPRYPNLRIEVPIGTRYKPDLVATDAEARPIFWGEAGKVGARKMHTLIPKFRHTHFAFAKWNSGLATFDKLVADSVAGVKRRAPVDLICFPEDSGERFIDLQGKIRVTLSDVPWRRYPAR